MRKHTAKICALLLSVACTAHAAEFVPFEASYDIRLGSLGGGEGIVRLELSGDRLLYSSSIIPRGLLALLFEKTLQISGRMRLEDGHIVAEEYSKTHARNKRRNQRYRFEAHGRSVEVLKKGHIYFLAVPEGTLDEASVQLQLIQDAQARNGPWHYTVISNGKLKHYRFAETGVEIIATALGNIETVRIERARLRDDRDDETDHYYWLSPAHRYLPVKIERLEDGRVKRTMSVKTISLETL